MRRRGLLQGIAALALAGLVAWPFVAQRPRYDSSGSYADGIALDSTGTLQLLPARSGAAMLAGSRVLVGDDDAEALAARQRAWLAEGWIPDGRDAELVASALLDLRLLSGTGAAVAAMTTAWRYVWPRDASFAAVAFAATGHLPEALEALDFLQAAQAPTGRFEARYAPNGAGPPDDRSPQTDGTGWALWALHEVVQATPVDEQAEVLARFDMLLQRSTSFLLAQTSGPRGLPEPSPDYWEHEEHVVTLGTAAPVLAGLEAAAALHVLAADTPTAAHVDAAASRLRGAIETFFGAHSYGRYPGPSHVDAATAFLLPPYQPTALDGAEQAWRDSVASMLRPAGGLAPGAGWREQNLSWTPATALYAYAAAAIGDDDEARRWLDWLGAHRTPIGALPEKVTADGAPAGPAPLAWTCALVVLTVVELERGAG